MRAILEGIGYALLSIAEIVEKNSGDYQRVMASGGFIKSPQWVQMMADIFGKEFRVLGADDASALGAALMGVKGLNIDTDFKFPAEKVFYPNPSAHERYGRYFSVYKNLYPHLSDDFHLLNTIVKS
jgi:gluconokinase